jgi:hypothetical protein
MFELTSVCLTIDQGYVGEDADFMGQVCKGVQVYSCRALSCSNIAFLVYNQDHERFWREKEEGR